MTRRAWTILGAGCAALALALALGPSDVPAHSRAWQLGYQSASLPFVQNATPGQARFELCTGNIFTYPVQPVSIQFDNQWVLGCVAGLSHFHS
jgi:hypothetical protein